MWVGRLIVTVVVLGVWQLVYVKKVFNPVVTGSPVEVAKFLVDNLVTSTKLWGSVGVTLWTTLIAFVVGSGLGIGCGLLFARSPKLEHFTNPFFTGFNSVPRIALAPLFIVWFGLSQVSSILVGVSLTFFILLSSTMAGVASLERDATTLLDTLGATERQRFFRATLPAAVPTLFSGLRLGLVYALLGVVSGEIIGAPAGLGEKLSYFAGSFETDAVFGVLIVLGVIGAVIQGVMTLAERKLLRWQ
jgi:NitT/TauT family transport system permease protein